MSRRRVIDGFENYYAHDEGYISNRKTGRILIAHPDSSGYMTVRLYENGVGYTRRVHRLIAETFLRQPSVTMWQVNHINGDKRDNRIENLEFVTASDNMKHSYENGLNHWEGYNETPVRILETGQVFRSQAECARAIEGYQANINACLMGRRYTHMGYHFEYADDEEVQ